MQTRIPAIALVICIAATACKTKEIPKPVTVQGHNFNEVHALAELPPAIQTSLGVGKPGLSGVAEAGQPYNVSDAVDPKLPMRRFLAAGHDGDTWIVALEQGGIAYFTNVFLFSARDATPKQKWVLRGGQKSLAEVIQEVTKKEQENR